MAAITRSTPELARERLGELEIRLPVAKQRRADDDMRRASRQDVQCAPERADAAADATRSRRADVPNERVVASGANRGVEVDQLQLRERREAADPRVEVGVFEGETLALDELNDFAAAEVDGGDEHGNRLDGSTVDRLFGYVVARLGGCSVEPNEPVEPDNRLTGLSGQSHRDAARLEVRLQVRDGVFRIVEDRRRQRGVRAAGREDVHEVIEGAGAA